MSTNRDKIAEWVGKYGDDLYRYALSKLSAKELAEDTVQDTFQAAYLAIDRFEGKSSPKTWLLSILKNKIIDYHRKAFKKNVISESEMPINNVERGETILERYFDGHGIWKNSMDSDWNAVSSDHLVEDPEFSVVLEKCIENLPEKGKNAIRYRYLQEKSGKAICKELNITPSNYWQLIHRAKFQLRDCLEKKWFHRQ